MTIERRFLLPLILCGTDIMKFWFLWVIPSTIQVIVLVRGKIAHPTLKFPAP